MAKDVSGIPALDSTRDHELRSQLPSLRHDPSLDVEELREAAAVFEALPQFEYPIASFVDLIAKLGGPNEHITIAGVTFRPVDMAGRMPATYFPIGSSDDFVAKVGELISKNRKKVPDPAKELKRIRRVLPSLSYPIKDRDALRKALEDTSIPFGRVTRTAQQVADAVPNDYFPIKSEQDLDLKALRLMQKRPLIEPKHDHKSQ